MKALLKKMAGLVLGEYAPYYIYRHASGDAVRTSAASEAIEVRRLDETALHALGGALVDDNIDYSGAGSVCFGAFVQGQLAGLCFYWFGDRYKTRNFWPLKDREAKLVQILVAPKARGHGVATALMRSSAVAMHQRSFDTLYARIWHSNHPSLGAIERAGWKRIALVVEINPLRRAKPLRFVRRTPA